MNAQPDERSWDELEQDAEREVEYGESWLPWKQPDQPQTLVGTVEGYDLARDFGYGQQWACTVIDRDRKRWTVWIGKPPIHTEKCSVLWRKFSEEQPQPGERIVVRHKGFVDTPKGGGPGYRSFGLTVDRGRQLPEFLTRPRLEAEAESDIPVDVRGLPATASMDVPDADVVEGPDITEGGDPNDPYADIPF